jgi:CDP-glucose 4,6-dehydratase
VENVVSTGSAWKGRSVLITGHTGFKGAWLSLWLSQLGARVSGFALTPDTEPNLFNLAMGRADVESVFADVRDFGKVRDCLERTQPEVIFHMAAQSLVRRSYNDPAGTYATNVMGTVNVLEAARQTGKTAAIIVVTSDKCYENREWVWPYRETDPMGGHDPYSSSKGCAELVTQAYRRSFFHGAGTPRLASVRAGNVIGGGDWSEDRLVPDIVRAMYDGASTEIRNPHSVRPWQHVLEPLGGYLLLAEHLLSSGGDTYAEAWNFGPTDDDCCPVSYIAERITKAWGGGAKWHLSNGDHPHEAAFLKVDSSKAHTRLGWRRRMPIDTALDWTAQWYRRQRDGEDAATLTLEQIDRYQTLQGQPA